MTATLVMLHCDSIYHIVAVAGALVLFLLLVSYLYFKPTDSSTKSPHTIHAYLPFFYSCFLKPHTGDDSGSQQDALESFYRAQAVVYDATRTRLLRGREDMLGLMAAQLKYRTQTGDIIRKPVWVDIGGGTGWNIEQMSAFVSVPDFFSVVYLVDLSPSLCDIARHRFERLGWENVQVVCQDARSFRLHEHGPTAYKRKEWVLENRDTHTSAEDADVGGADLITMSYSLSMIPEYHLVIDSISSLLSPNGVIGVCDFYVQSKVDYQCRNYTGGVINRHCTWLSRVFWRAWFELDRVHLTARRDYLEYRFGTILSVNARNHMLGVRIPYYVWVGCSKDRGSTASKLAELEAAATESPFLSALDLQAKTARQGMKLVEVRSKAYESAIINLQSSLPLPSSWYQNNKWRIYYDDQLRKHRQFNDECLYQFTWEDSRMDRRLLQIGRDDVILSITSAGDNILAYALEAPARIHAVDLNPAQNHLLELKVAAFTALGYSDVWKLFGEGQHGAFRDLLIKKLSPHMSSLAFQHWLNVSPTVFSRKNLYETGGSGHALRLVGWLFRALGLSDEAKRLYSAQTLNEQREIWERSIKRVLLSRILCWTVISNEKWLWKALGVPPNQCDMIEQDYLKQDDIHGLSAIRSGQAIWEYVVNTLEPVVNSTLISDDNHYYLLCLQGKYSRRCHPDYLTPKAHIKLSKPDAFDGLRIHTDEINEVIARMSPSILTIAVVMDSMDWFSPTGPEAAKQIKALNRVMRLKGRVLLRSAGLTPWYIETFEELGFSAKRVAARFSGTCSDRGKPPALVSPPYSNTFSEHVR
ncbi:hypothetical protein H2199_003249 [Coniosporium tulheliwenetii]|uniref:Uncharacterized protein n=1 Tax=Coniosporium tulheliwenetii TaxID=3383036 RepID=A0ACC2ZD46_9PEZI|nr:hypothetical protein H2199_003249 [Cladosporium sp. JES 115]